MEKAIMEDQKKNLNKLVSDKWSMAQRGNKRLRSTMPRKKTMSGFQSFELLMMDLKR